MQNVAIVLGYGLMIIWGGGLLYIVLDIIFAHFSDRGVVRRSLSDLYDRVKQLEKRKKK